MLDKPARATELINAIGARLDTGHPIPLAWVAELNDLNGHHGASGPRNGATPAEAPAPPTGGAE